MLLAPGCLARDLELVRLLKMRGPACGPRAVWPRGSTLGERPSCVSGLQVGELGQVPGGDHVHDHLSGYHLTPEVTSFRSQSCGSRRATAEESMSDKSVSESRLALPCKGGILGETYPVVHLP